MNARSPIMRPRASRRSFRWGVKAAALMLLAVAVTMGTALAAARPAAAEPVSQIVGRWISPPATTASGKPVVADWRVNLNDGSQPPGNQPVDNVTAVFTIGHGTFAEIPDICLTKGVDPVSAISADGTTLTCNLGTVTEGTAIAIQTPVNAKGVTGDELTLSGSIDGKDVALDPIRIVNPFKMDMRWETASGLRVWSDSFDQVTLDLDWTLFQTPDGDPGPNSVTYRLTVTDSNDAPVLRTTSIDTGQVGCAENRRQAPGHPFSGRPDLPERNAPFPTCTLTAVAGQPGKFDLTLSDIDYSQTMVPVRDSANLPMPTDMVAIAAGSVWFRVVTTQAGSVQLQSSAPTYTAPTGQTSVDDPSNNTENKVYPLPGSWSSSWQRTYTGSGGDSWDDTYRLPAGSQLREGVNTRWYTDNVATNAQYGLCAPLDTRYVIFDRAQLWNFANDYAFQYYTGDSPLLNPAAGNGQYNPDQFDCGTATGWSTTLPADLSQVRAVRVRFPFSEYAASHAATNNVSGLGMYAFVDIKPGVPAGQDVWSFGSAERNGTWVGPDGGSPLTTTPNARYPYTNGRRDIVRVTTATPAIKKSVERTTVVPGVPVTYSLAYSANFSGQGPATVDGYKIVDTLPAGMSYVAGSASPAPVVTTVNGHQVLTWTIDGVTTNTEHPLTYQAVANSDVQPGVRLTNSAVSSLGDNESDPATATVTTTTNGHTTILKTSDVAFIPNDNGDGVGAGSWTVTIASRDPYPQAYTDTIDVLPYNGDQRGTSFAGTYSLVDVVLADGGTVYYTDADPATINFDPADPSNGAAGNPAGNTVGWTQTKPAHPTAIRVVGGVLASGGSYAFQVKIATDGAAPQDTYVNSAQARAEHTELVMRTSASLTVTDYRTVKTSDPIAGATVVPGQKITYTITVTQLGKVPAGARFTDTLSGVTDDAVYNNDAKADQGRVSVANGVISWAGTIPVGGVAHVTYSVTVKDVAGLKDGNKLVDNKVASPGCQSTADCTVTHPVGWYVYSKTSDPKPGSVVGVGDVITYTVRVAQQGKGAIAKADVTDDLTKVLDDATWDDTAKATSGKVAYSAPHLTWTGSLDVGQVVTLTYTVTVTGAGDFHLANVVTAPTCAPGDTSCVPSQCVDAPDGNPGCRTEHTIGDWQIEKQSDPRTGTTVAVGDTITYTVTVRHIGLAPVTASLRDDLTKVLDDATWNGDLKASAGKVSYAAPTLTWSGDLKQGDVVTITYSVTTKDGGDRHLKNVVTTDGRCVPADGQTVACTTEHQLPTPPAPPVPPLAGTGAPLFGWPVLAGGLLLILVGGGTALTAGISRRRYRLRGDAE